MLVIAKRMKRDRISTVFIAIVCGIACRTGYTQTELISFKPASIEFDVVSIRKAKDEGSPLIYGKTNSDAIRYQTWTLEDLVENAYATTFVTRLPPWGRTEYFNVDAKVAGPDLPKFMKYKESRDQIGLRVMLQHVLADRFSLRVHTSIRQVPGYSLGVGRRGCKMTPSSFHPIGQDGDAYYTPGSRYIVRGATVKRIVEMISGVIESPVDDGTGLQGRYDFTLKWDPNTLSRNSNPDAPRIPVLPGGENLSFSSAVQEQLGLKLMPQKVMRPEIVIDHVKEPSPN